MKRTELELEFTGAALGWAAEELEFSEPEISQTLGVDRKAHLTVESPLAQSLTASFGVMSPAAPTHCTLGTFYWPRDGGTGRVSTDACTRRSRAPGSLRNTIRSSPKFPASVPKKIIREIWSRFTSWRSACWI